MVKWFFFSLLLGSFFNVCIHRIPRGESLAFPPSHCPRCQHRLAPLDLIPVISFLFLRGQCRYCRSPISWRYPAVELLTAALFTLAWFRFGWSWDLLYALILTSVLIIVTFIDWDTQMIPDGLTLPGIAAGLIFSFGPQGATPWDSLLGLLAGGLPLLLIAVASQGGMGGGDIKLMAMAGTFLGWKLTLLALFLSFLAGGIVGVFLLLTHKKGRKDAVPFGPFLALGSFAALLYGPALLTWYFSLLGVL